MRRSTIICLVLALSGGVHAQPPRSEADKNASSAGASGEGGAVPADGGSGPVAEVAAASDTQETGERPAQRAVIRHVPQNELVTGEGELSFTIEHPELAGSVMVRYRSGSIEGGKVQQVPAYRSVGGYVARVPADDVQPPGFVYWSVERMPDGSERPVFADAKNPHPVQVNDPVDMARERDELAARGGDRSRLFVTGEYVDFGSRRVVVGSEMPEGGGEPRSISQRFQDNYYHLQAGYAFSFFSTVDEIRFNVGRLSGKAADLPDNGQPEQFEPAIYYGESAITWFLITGLRLRTSLILGISHAGFEGGGGGELVLGHPDRTNLALGLKGVTTLGITGRVRLGFLAVPRVPMGAAVEITDFPVGSDYGVRLLYDVGYQLAPGTVLALYGGYQGRTSVMGGFSLGGNLAYAF